MSSIENSGFIGELGELLRAHDPTKSDLSHRAEGTMQTIGALARTSTLSEHDANDLGAAIVHACLTYKQVEMIGRGDNAVAWPTNRFAIAALKDLKIKRPVV